MSCACEHKRLSGELARARRLAKALARAEDAIVAIVRNADGSYGICVATPDIERPIIEYLTPY